MSAICNLRRLHITSFSYIYISRNLKINLQNYPTFKWISILYLTNFKLLLFLPNAQVRLMFHEKYKENLLLSLLHYLTVLRFYSIVWKFSKEDMEIFAEKWRFTYHIFLLKSRSVKFFCYSNHGDISPCSNSKVTLLKWDSGIG